MTATTVTPFDTLDRFQGNPRNIWAPIADLEKPQRPLWEFDTLTTPNTLTTSALAAVSIIPLPFLHSASFASCFHPLRGCADMMEEPKPGFGDILGHPSSGIRY